MEKSIWQRIGKIVSSTVALAVFTLVSYAEVYVFVSGSLFEAIRLLYGASFLYLTLFALLIVLTVCFGIGLFLSVYHPSIERNGLLCLCAELLTVLIGAASIKAINVKGETVKPYGPVALHEKD